MSKWSVVSDNLKEDIFIPGHQKFDGDESKPQKRKKFSFDANQVVPMSSSQFVLSNQAQNTAKDYKNSPAGRTRSLITPTSRFMHKWDLVIATCLIFTALITPFELAFLSVIVGNPLFVVNRMVDLCFLVN
jgi:hypothetical protein